MDKKITEATTGIIGGDWSEMLSQNNLFIGYTLSQALMMGEVQLI